MWKGDDDKISAYVSSIANDTFQELKNLKSVHGEAVIESFIPIVVRMIENINCLYEASISQKSSYEKLMEEYQKFKKASQDDVNQRKRRENAYLAERDELNNEINILHEKNVNYERQIATLKNKNNKIPPEKYDPEDDISESPINNYVIEVKSMKKIELKETRLAKKLTNKKITLKQCDSFSNSSDEETTETDNFNVRSFSMDNSQLLHFDQDSSLSCHIQKNNQMTHLAAFNDVINSHQNLITERFDILVKYKSICEVLSNITITVENYRKLVADFITAYKSQKPTLSSVIDKVSATRSEPPSLKKCDECEYYLKKIAVLEYSIRVFEEIHQISHSVEDSLSKKSNIFSRYFGNLLERSISPINAVIPDQNCHIRDLLGDEYDNIRLRNGVKTQEINLLPLEKVESKALLFHRVEFYGSKKVQQPLHCSCQASYDRLSLEYLLYSVASPGYSSMIITKIKRDPEEENSECTSELVQIDIEGSLSHLISVPPLEKKYLFVNPFLVDSTVWIISKTGFIRIIRSQFETYDVLYSWYIGETVVLDAKYLEKKVILVLHPDILCFYNLTSYASIENHTLVELHKFLPRALNFSFSEVSSELSRYFAVFHNVILTANFDEDVHIECFDFFIHGLTSFSQPITAIQCFRDFVLVMTHLSSEVLVFKGENLYFYSNIVTRPVFDYLGFEIQYKIVKIGTKIKQTCLIVQDSLLLMSSSSIIVIPDIGKVIEHHSSGVSSIPINFVEIKLQCCESYVDVVGPYLLISEGVPIDESETKSPDCERRRVSIFHEF